MSKTPVVKPPVIPIVNENKVPNPTAEGPIVSLIGWYETNSGFKAVSLNLSLQLLNSYGTKDLSLQLLNSYGTKDLTPEGPKPRNHVADVLKVALVKGFINPVGGK